MNNLRCEMLSNALLNSLKKLATQAQSLMPGLSFHLEFNNFGNME